MVLYSVQDVELDFGGVIRVSAPGSSSLLGELHIPGEKGIQDMCHKHHASDLLWEFRGGNQHFHRRQSVMFHRGDVTLELHINNLCSCDKQRRGREGRRYSSVGSSLNEILEAGKQEIF